MLPSSRAPAKDPRPSIQKNSSQAHSTDSQIFLSPAPVFPQTLQESAIEEFDPSRIGSPPPVPQSFLPLLSPPRGRFREKHHECCHCEESRQKRDDAAIHTRGLLRLRLAMTPLVGVHDTLFRPQFFLFYFPLCDPPSGLASEDHVLEAVP